MSRFWTPEQDAYLKQHYSNTSSQEIAEALNRSIKSIHTRAGAFGLKKSPEYISQTTSNCWKLGKMEKCRKSQFSNGHQTWNKGTKGLVAPNSGNFPKGLKPHNYQPVGTIVELRDGYSKIKIAEPRQWKLLHVHIWEQANGPVPKKHVLAFKDGNVKNHNLDNLQLLTMKENMLRNSIQNYPEDIKSTIRVLTKLNKTISNYGKEQNSRS